MAELYRWAKDMSAFSFRRPVFKSLLVIGAIFVAIWCYALATDTMIIPPSRSQPGKILKRSEHPGDYRFFMWYFGTVAAACVSISLVRFIPVEDRFAVWKKTIKAKAELSGATTKPAPVWAYVFLGGFIAFIGYLGYIFMYKE